MAEPSASDLFPGLQLWAQLVIAVFVVCLSAFFAGSTLGLLSLDKVGLEIVMQASEDLQERKYARIVAPIRKHGNLLLCTLLIGNTVANSFLSILLSNVTTGIVGLVISTALLVVFAEIIPQSICSRHGLRIGAYTSWLIKFFMVILAPVAWPLAFILDKALGREVGNIYTRSELKHLIGIHVENPEHQNESGLTREDHQMLSGVLDYRDKRVKDVMTPMDKVYMVEAHVRLNFDNMLEIYKSGYTRIPVYDTQPQAIIGILYTKDLILVDPDDEIEIRTLVSFHGKSSAQYILDITPLNEVFTLFKTSRTHMFLACRLVTPAPPEVVGPDGVVAVRSQQDLLAGKDGKEVTGVITLEDVLEEVIQDEIVDESDRYMTNDHTQAVVRRPGRDRPDVSAFLALFEHKIRDQSRLSLPEVQAIAAYLSTSVAEFSVFSHADAVLKGLVRQAEVIECGIDEEEEEREDLGTRHSQPMEPEDGFSERATGTLLSRLAPTGGGGELVLYERGVPSSAFVLILQGKVVVRAGTEGFQSEQGPWSYLGAKALRGGGGAKGGPYVPDFDAVTAGSCRLLRITAEAYAAALRMGRAAEGRAADQIVGVRAVKQVINASVPYSRSAGSLIDVQRSDPAASPGRAAAGARGPADGVGARVSGSLAGESRLGEVRVSSASAGAAQGDGATFELAPLIRPPSDTVTPRRHSDGHARQLPPPPAGS